jgi:putative MATE family efflux protein
MSAGGPPGRRCRPACAIWALHPRTRLLLEGPIASTLLRLAAPNILVMLAQASVGLIETYFVGKLGTQALAGMALVFPLVMLMQMMSAGAVGGGIASAIARAIGGRRQAEANALLVHAGFVAAGFGLLFTVTMIGGGRWLYARMGGSGESLQAAVTYSDWVFAGALLVWLFNSLAAAIRGTGNMMVPAVVTCCGVLILIPLSPLLIFGWGPIPALGIAGGAIALLTYYAIGAIVLGAYLASAGSQLRATTAGIGLRRALFKNILGVGLAGTVSTAATNLSIGVATALASGFGAPAIAGYGTAARLEYLLVPLVFGLGAPLVAMVGACIGAGLPQRALRATWIGAGIAVALTEAIGLLAAVFAREWLSLFDSDPLMIQAGMVYLATVAPLYGFFGLGLLLYFASQGAGRLFWPVAANVLRLVVAALGGWLAIRLGGSLLHMLAVQGGALVVYGTVSAAAIACGAWFGPLRWPLDGLRLRTRTGAAAASPAERTASRIPPAPPEG